MYDIGILKISGSGYDSTVITRANRRLQPDTKHIKLGSHSNKGMQMVLKIGSKKAATAPATIAAPATPAHWACALDAKRGVSRHLWEQHGSAGKRAPAATSSKHHVKGTCTCSAQRTAHSTLWPSGSRVYATAAWPHRLPSDVILTSSDVI